MVGSVDRERRNGLKFRPIITFSPGFVEFSTETYRQEYLHKYMAKALIIGGSQISPGLASTLHSAGFEVLEFDPNGLGWPGLTGLRDECPDLLITGEDPVGNNEIELLPALRNLTTAPIIAMGSSGAESAYRALIQGADAYLPVSASAETLLAYINALLRRQAIPSAAA